MPTTLLPARRLREPPPSHSRYLRVGDEDLPFGDANLPVADADGQDAADCVRPTAAVPDAIGADTATV